MKLFGLIGYTVTCFCSTHVGRNDHITAEVTAKLVSREPGVFSLCVRRRIGGASRRSVTHTHTHTPLSQEPSICNPTHGVCACSQITVCVHTQTYTHTCTHTPHQYPCLITLKVSNPSAALMHSLEGGGRGREREGGGRGREREGGGKRRKEGIH